MISLRSCFTYPLLARELTERAARRRTYLVRVAFGLALYGFFLAVVQQAIVRAAADETGIGAIGFGHDLLRALVQLLSWSVLLVQPALMAGVLTYEKERDAFPLLRLTGMSPTKLLFEKYLAGLLPMATLLLLALPLASITMGYGGVSAQLLAVGSIVIVSTWLCVGAWALFCSAWCHSTMGAFLLSYLGGAFLFLAPALFYSITKRYVLFGADLTAVTVPPEVWAAWPPEIFARLVDFQSSGLFSAAAYRSTWMALLAESLWKCAPLLIAAGVFLLLARIVLLFRAAPAASDRVRSSLGRIVQMASRGALKLRPQRHDLPADDPITWRESGRSVLGRRTRFFYLVLVASLVTLAVATFLLGLYPKTAGPQRLHNLAVFIGAATVVVLTARSVNALLSEQSNQTLDILFTTPLGADEIIRQKARALGRYWLLFGCMLGIVFGLQGWSEFQYVRASMFWRQLGQYWATAGLALVVYPPLIIWVAMFVAVCWRRRARAMFTGLLIFATWFFAPLLILKIADPLWQEKPALLWSSLASPLGILNANEQDILGHFFRTHQAQTGRVRTVVGEPWAPVAANFLFYGLLMVGVRAACLRSADRLLRK